MWNYNFFVYITTNPDKTVLYTGVTNAIRKRMSEHHENRGKWRTFAGRYFCYNLIWYEQFNEIKAAIMREKEIKGWRREKKEVLIAKTNPNWDTIYPE
jgi:putative endonuclease